MSDRVWFDGKFHPTAIYARESLPLKKRFRGPAIITEYSATTVVAPGATFQLDSAGNVIISVR
jgi:N-methylhydantoinase A